MDGIPETELENMSVIFHPEQYSLILPKPLGAKKRKVPKHVFFSTSSKSNQSVLETPFATK